MAYHRLDAAPNSHLNSESTFPFRQEDEDVDAEADDEESTAIAQNEKPQVAPLPPPAPPAPDTQLSLEWVYGYTAAACRGSVRYTASGAVSGGVSVVYPAGKVVVVLSQPLDEDGAETEGKCLNLLTIKTCRSA